MGHHSLDISAKTSARVSVDSRHDRSYRNCRKIVNNQPIPTVIIKIGTAKLFIGILFLAVELSRNKIARTLGKRNRNASWCNRRLTGAVRWSSGIPGSTIQFHEPSLLPSESTDFLQKNQAGDSWEWPARRFAKPQPSGFVKGAIGCQLSARESYRSAPILPTADSR